MRKIIILLFALLVCHKASFSQAGSRYDKEDLYDLCSVAFKNVNFSSHIPEDSILNMCQRLKDQYKNKQNVDSLFVILEIEVNALCLKGEMGLALNKAKQMYEQAKELDNQVGIGLAFQAIGDTYLHSGQYQKADESFSEAYQLIELSQLEYSKLKLIIQQMYVYTEIQDIVRLKKNIDKAIDLSDDLRTEHQADIDFYIECYQTLFYIAIQDRKQAYQHLWDAQKIEFPHNNYDPWKYHIYSRYYELTQEYEKSLKYNDSVLQCLRNKNPNAYIKFSIPRAELYELNNEYLRACMVYQELNNLADSLKMSQYASQVDSLHVIYLVDQLKVKNAASYNSMLAQIIGYNILGLIIIIIFLSIAKRKNRQLKESQIRLSETRYQAADSIRSKSLFLSNMSHELRTPLSAIVGFTGLLAENNEMDYDTKKQCADIIKLNSKLLLKLINDIADLAELKENRFNFVWSNCDVVELCKSVTASMETVMQNKLSFVTDLKELEIETDKGRLQQIIMNLLTNANKFTKDGNITLKLNLSKEKDVAIFTVEDTGCGVPLDKQENIFKRFEKLNENIQGVGLGLSISQLLIEHAGGRIWLDSSYTKGARFVFIHPIKQSSSVESQNE